MEERDDILALTDEEGNEVNFEIIDALEHNAKTYLLLAPADETEDEEMEVIMLRVDDAGEEDVLVTVDDEEEFNAVAALFDAKAEEYELEGEGCDCDGTCDCDCGCHKE